MRLLRRFFMHPGTLGIIGLSAFTIIIWIGADYIKFGANNRVLSHTLRLMIIGIVASLWAGWHLSLLMIKRRHNRQLISKLGQAESFSATHSSTPASTHAADVNNDAGKADQQAISQQFTHAINTLKNKRFRLNNGRHQTLYQLPWYIVIGPPDAGKTTVLANSGLHFPLATPNENLSMSGIGGTRHCDWWFTNDAVLIDTAGRYTTQDSHKKIDQSGWLRFIQLLKQYRRRRPINGAILTVSIQDLLIKDEESLKQQAKTLRSRLNELQNQLGIRFPVYLLFTKCDLIAGFDAFFSHLSQDERKQVWGFSFQDDQPIASDTSESGSNKSQLSTYFFHLIERLNQQLLWRIQEERQLNLRAQLQGFPSRMASLSQALETFVQHAFAPSHFDLPPRLRGVYFNSATQEGTPIDRMMNAINQHFGLSNTSPPHHRRNQNSHHQLGKSYFIHKLLSDVIFPEAELVGVNRNVERRMRWLRCGSLAAIAFLVIGSSTLWTKIIQSNKVKTSQVEWALAEFEHSQKKLLASGNHRTLSEEMLSEEALSRQMLPRQALPLLNSLEKTTLVYTTDYPSLKNLGLYHNQVGQAAEKLYRHHLETTYFKALQNDLERQLSPLNGKDDALFNTLRVYLMLSDPSHRELDRVRQFFTSHWQHQLKGQAGDQAMLLRHFDELFKQPVITLASPSDSAIAVARQKLQQTPPEQRLYAQFRSGKYAQQSVNTALSIGNDIQPVFGRALEDPFFQIPALFTLGVYRQLKFDEHSPLLKQTSDNHWVFGATPEGEDFSEADLKQLGADTHNLYLRDYLQHWQTYSEGLHLKHFNNGHQAMNLLHTLGDPLNSPFVRALQVIADNTQLSHAFQLPSSVGKAPINGASRQIGHRVLSDVNNERSNRSQATAVDHHFSEIHRLLRSENGQPPLIHLYLEQIQQLKSYLTAIEASPNSQQAAYKAAKIRFSGAASEDPIQLMRMHASSAPSPLKHWMTQLADDTWALVMRKAGQYLNQVWKDEVYRHYHQYLANRYPLANNSDSETSAVIFNDFFKPDGIQQQFVKVHLQPFIDTKRWKVESFEGQRLTLKASTLRHFKQADSIRQALFRNGSQAAIHFHIEPKKLDPSVRLFSLSLGDARITFSHGPRIRQRLTWVSGAGSPVGFVFEDLNNSLHRKQFEGDWAWWRMMEQSQIRSVKHNTAQLITFETKTRQAQFLLQAETTLNPFNPELLKSYRISQTL